MAEPVDPTPLDTLEALKRRAALDVRVGVPGIVQEYDDETQMAVVQPAIRAKDRQGRAADKPPVKVPAAWMRAGGWTIQASLEPGDTVHLDVLDRHQGTWLAEGGVVDQARSEPGQLANAVARPDYYPRNAPLPPAGDGLRISRADPADKGSEIVLGKDGSITMGSLKSGLTVTLTADGLLEIRGAGTLRKVARNTDPVARNAAMATWMAGVELASGAPALVGNNIGTVSATSNTTEST